MEQVISLIENNMVLFWAGTTFILLILLIVLIVLVVKHKQLERKYDK